jgi:hypothetical protein
MNEDKRPHVVCCGILKKEVQKLVDKNSLDVKVHFLDAGLHVDYAKLEKVLTSAIEVCSKHGAKGIVVVYGDLCHPKIKEIVGKYGKSVKVDALNCIDCLLGGHRKLLQIDPNSDHFYLSPGWMPSNVEKNENFRQVFDWSQKEIKLLFRDLNGIILIDSLGNLDEFESDIEKFRSNTGLQVTNTEEVGIRGLEAVLFEALKKLENQSCE